MRRVFMLFLIISVAVAVFAATSWSWSAGSVDSGSDSPFTPVTVDTTGTKQALIGFTSEEVNNSSAYSETLSNPIDSNGIELTVANSTGIATNNANSLYAAWMIQSGGALNLYIYGDGDLKIEGSESGIGWKVSSEGKTYVDCTSKNSQNIFDSKPESYNGNFIYQHTPSAESVNGGKYKNFGSIPLTVTSESVWNFPAGKYTANLYFVIESVGE